VVVIIRVIRTDDRGGKSTEGVGIRSNTAKFGVSEAAKMATIRFLPYGRYAFYRRDCGLRM
jgi:hypothetical protein